MKQNGWRGKTQLKHNRTCGSENHKAHQVKKEIQAGHAAQQVERLPGMREAMGSIPGIAKVRCGGKYLGGGGGKIISLESPLAAKKV